MKINLQKSQNEFECDGPLQIAPDPTEKFFESNKETKPHVNPTRQWGSEAGPSYQNPNTVINNWPAQQHGNSNSLRNNRKPKNYENEDIRSQNSDGAVTDHASSINEDSVVTVDQSSDNENNSDNENGFEFSSAYKKKLNRLEKLKQNNHEKLTSMKRNIASRFLLTSAKPSMSVEAVELYILENFSIGEVYVRKNAMKYTNRSSFIFIINSTEELDTDELEDHEWPWRIQCFWPRITKTKKILA